MGLAWDWGGGIGWGVAGLHIALALAGDERILPVPLGRAHLFEASEAQRSLLKPSLDAAALLNATDRYDDQSISTGDPLPFPVVHALGRWGVRLLSWTQAAGPLETWASSSRRPSSGLRRISRD